jgi:hypothetical protein
MTNRYFHDISFHGIREINLASWTPDLSEERRGELAFDFLEKFVGQKRCNIKNISFEASSDGLVADMMERIKALGSVESVSAFRSRQKKLPLDTEHRMKELDRCFAYRGEKWAQLTSLNLLAISRYSWLKNVEAKALGTKTVSYGILNVFCSLSFSVDSFQQLTTLSVPELCHTSHLTRLSNLKCLEFYRFHRQFDPSMALPTSLTMLRVCPPPSSVAIEQPFFYSLSALTNLKEIHISDRYSGPSMDWIHPLRYLREISLNLGDEATEALKSHLLCSPLTISSLKLTTLPTFMLDLEHLTELDLQHAVYAPDQISQFLDLCRSQDRLKQLKRLCFDVSEQFIDLDPISGATIVHLRRFHEPTFLFPRLEELHMGGGFHTRRSLSRHAMATAFAELLTSMIDAGIELHSLTAPTGFLSSQVWDIIVQKFGSTLKSLNLIASRHMREWNRTPVTAEILSRVSELSALQNLRCHGVIDVANDALFNFLTNHPSLHSWTGSKFQRTDEFFRFKLST